MKKIELLSPAGDYECLKQAVFGGANAVYFGAKSFNARAKAENFGAEMQDAVAFCHMYGVKTYLTLNTIVENNQIDDLLQTINHAIMCGIDAFIVQDFGVLNILKNCYSNIEIHASTQMAVNNYLGAINAEKMGIKRVVLSRETNVEDIKLIKKHTNLEIEYFVQGALCVCFSGNCYLSSKLFGKSGNKGECLQPCRLPYKAMLKNKTIKEGYLLSAKDLCFAGRLKELIDAGVDSLKIEGRLRRSGYVAGVTRVYRKIIDNDFIVNEEDLTNIKKCFNRGDFTEGYLNGNHNIIDYFIQGHKGIKIGGVIGFEKGKKFNIIKIKTNYPLNSGDGLKFIFNNKEIATISAVDLKMLGNIATVTTTSNVLIGCDVYLILDSKKEKQDTSGVKLLPVDFNLIANQNQPLLLEYDFNGTKGRVIGNICEMASSLPLTELDAKTQLAKLGDTNFYLQNFTMQTDGVFVRKQDLNNLRRNAIEELKNKFICTQQPICNLEYINLTKNLYNETINKSTKTIEIVNGFTSNADFFVVKPKDYLNFDYHLISHNNVYLYIPAFLRNEDIEIINSILNKHENLGVYAENIGALNFNRKTILGAKLNIKNIYAVKELLNKNVVCVITSPELTKQNHEQINKCFNLPIIQSTWQNFDLMTFVHCPIKTLFKNTCAKCMFEENILYKMENGKTFKLNRYKVKNCYFTLVEV